MNESVSSLHSHLFTVRLWREEIADGEGEWRGKVQHVLSGETRYFKAWPDLIVRLMELLPASDTGLAAGGTATGAAAQDPSSINPC